MPKCIIDGKEFEFKPDVTVPQKGETLTGTPSNMKNFVAGKVAKGDRVQGMVELPSGLVAQSEVEHDGEGLAVVGAGLRLPQC